jgi:4-hydroxythreonine-4-phosphate dehydrogenase
MSRRPCLAITLGDPCGIGPELLLGALAVIRPWADVVVIGARAGVDLLAASATPARLAWRWGEAPRPDLDPGAEVRISGLYTEGGEATWLDPTADVDASQLQLGVASAVSGRCAVEAVRLGAELVMAGKADALVTLPLSKTAAHMAGHHIPGHTEFLQDLCGSPITRMAFVSPRLMVVLHTVHQSLRSVVEDLSVEAVAETLAFAADRFMQLTGKLDLRVALCALNPHAGEGGAFGQEETILDEALVQAEAAFMNFGGEDSSPFANIPSPFGNDPAPADWSIYPGPRPGIALMGARRDLEILDLSAARTPLTRPAPQFHGPLPADTLFLRAARGEFDMVVALYHDQGLIPIKVLEPDRAVNLTLGLPYIRTSPDHGTAFDRAGKWTSSATNFLEATALAVRLAGRAKHQDWQAEVSAAEAGE